MNLTAKVKLLPTAEQAQLLQRTLEVANAACDRISNVAWKEKTFGQYSLHHLVYPDIRAKFGLAAQVVVRCISKVADAYKTGRKTKRTFQPFGGIAYDSRILSFNLEQFTVSIWTVGGRQRMAFVCGPRQRELLLGQRGESDLCLVDGAFYLFATCEIETPEPIDVEGFLGVDLGVKNIATDSDGNVYSGSKVNGLRKRHAKLRAKLQAKGTRAAKRLLKKRRQKEARFAHHINHCIAKELVLRAKDTGRGIALEDLTGIRKRVTVRRAQRRQHHSWSFFDLRTKIEYKARRAGIPVTLVDPRNTSRTCPACGRIDKRNRPDQGTFSCVSCGHCGHADTIAAGNVARRAAVNRPNVTCVETKTGHDGTAVEHSHKPTG